MRTLCLVLILMTACATRVHTGAVGSTTDSAPGPAAQLSVHQDILLFGVAGRSMLGSEHSSAALGVELAAPPGLLGARRQPFSPHASLGVHALQWDWSDGDRTFGAGSPYAQLGGSLCRGRRGGDVAQCIGLSFDTAYHLRFGNDSQLWMGGSVVLSRMHDPTHPNARPRNRRGKRRRR